MALPARPATSILPTNAVAPVAPVAPVDAQENDNENYHEGSETVARTIKQFGPARIEVNGQSELAPVPTVQGVKLVDISKELFASLKNIVAAKGVTDFDAFIEEAYNVDKTSFPGNKEGKASYTMTNVMRAIAKDNGMLNAVRGATGGAVMKARLVEKDSKIQELEKQLAALQAMLSGAK